MSKKVSELIEACRMKNYHVSVTWQSITGYSVEIYTGYTTNYKKIFYTDGHVKLNDAVKKANRFLTNKEQPNDK